MSGSRFVLVVLCLLVSYSIGAFAVMSWNTVRHRTAAPMAQKPRITEESRVLSRRALKPGAQSTYSGSDLDAKVAANTVPISPTFDVVRVEPNGEAVFAGRAEAGWKVYLEAANGPIGQAIADRSGQWVIIPDKPIMSGEHKIKLSARAPSKNVGEVSGQSVVVAVAGSRKTTPRVALVDTNGRTKVLQEPSQAEITAVPPAKPNVAKGAAAPTAESEKAVGEKSGGEPGTKAAKTSELVSVTQTARSSASESVNRGNGAAETRIAQSGKSTNEDATEIKAAPSDEKPAAQEKPGGRKQADKETPSMPDGVRDLFMGGRKQNNVAGGTAKEPFAEKQQLAVKSPPIPVPLVSFGIVKYERSVGKSGYLSVKGNALPGTRIRLYMGMKHIGTVTAEASGDWSFHEELPLPPGNHKLRAEQVDQSGKVLARANKLFEWALPKPATVARVEELPGADRPAAVPKSPAPPAEKMSPSTKPSAVPAAKKDLPKTAARANQKAEPVGDPKSNASAPVRPQGVPDETRRTASPPTGTQSQDMADSAEKRTAALDAKRKAAQLKERDRAGASASRKRIWRRRGNWKKRKTVRTANARAAMSAAMAARLKTMRSRRMVVVRRGDTLWDIAESYYGRGIRYKVIYKRNRDKIRDPHWIYPRQRFKLP